MASFQYGEKRLGYFVAESTFGTGVKPAAGDGFVVTDMQITPNYEFHDVPDRRGTRSRMEQVPGRKGATFTMSGTLRPSGAAGTAPDIGLILKHAMGTQPISSSTSGTDSLKEDPSDMSGTLYHQLDDIQEGVVGAIIQTLNFSWNGRDFVTWDASGIGVDVLEAGTTLANGAGRSTATLTVDDADFFAPYGVIKIGSSDNSGAGHQITAVNYSNNQLTLESNASWSDNDPVIPFLPTMSNTGSPIYGTKGKLSLDGDSSEVKHTGGSLSINTGLDLHNDEFGSETAQAVVLAGERVIDHTIDMLVRDTTSYEMSLFRRDAAQDIVVTLGDGAGAQMVIDMPTSRIRPAPRTGTTGPISVSLSGPALGSGGEDELTLLFN